MNQLSQKLGVEMTPEIRNLGSNDLISKALVDHAVQLGKNINDIDKELISID